MRPLLLLCVWAMAWPALAADWKPWTGGPAAALSLQDLNGQKRSLSEFRGRVVVLNFWATWCEPCIDEMPSLQSLADRHSGKPLVVVGVNLGEGEARIRGFLAKTGTSFPLLLDRDGVAKKAWRVNGVPTTFLIDANGKVRYSLVGQADFHHTAVEEVILRLLSTTDRPQKK